MINEYDGEYLLISNVRTNNKFNINTDIKTFESVKNAEIEFYNEVTTSLQDDSIILAHYVVTNEYGVKQNNLERIIDNLSKFNIEQE